MSNMQYTEEEIKRYDEIYENIIRFASDRRRNLKKLLEKAIQQGYPLDYDHSVLQYNLPLWWLVVNTKKRNQNIDNICDILKLILENGADPDRTNSYMKENLLHYSITNRYPLDIVQIILERTKDINHADVQGRTALYKACEIYAFFASGRQYWEIIKQLLKAGANPNTEELKEWLNTAYDSEIAQKKNNIKMLFESYAETSNSCSYTRYDYEL